MTDHLALLERIAEVAHYVRDLKRSLEVARDLGRVRASLAQANATSTGC